MCEFCPAGTFSNLIGATSCTKCPAGSSALKALYLTQFDSWKELGGMWTDCYGECASEGEGWQLRSDSIDSGIGHGVFVDVNLYLNVTLDSPGYVEWKYNVICSSKCSFQISDVGMANGTFAYSASEETPTATPTRFLKLSAGNHTIKWVFSKLDGTVLNAYYDRLVIHEIIVRGVKDGGAISCESCAAGTAAAEGSTFCAICPRGSYSGPAAASCTLCPEGFFGNRTGATFVNCLPCGANTKSLPDRSDCDYNGCTFKAAEGIVYDLSPLQIEPGDDLYGPVSDQKGHFFYLNPCTRAHSNRTCFNIDKQPIYSHACQQLPVTMGYSMDLGYIQGYSNLTDTRLAEDPLRSGLVMSFTQGSYGCPKYFPSFQPPSPRSTNITFICNPLAGKGFPVAVEPVEEPSCRYNFMWSSLYACPLCTMNDYDVVLGQCLGGFQQKNYVPKTFPNRCQGGIQAPPPERVACDVRTIDCPPGTYLSPDTDTEAEPTCKLARRGRYSVGGGTVVDLFDQFDTLPSYFERSGGWTTLGTMIRSGDGDTALTAKPFLVKNGTVYFEYKVVAYDASATGFRFMVDDEMVSVLALSTHYSYMSASFSLKSGERVLSWRFIGGSTPSAAGRGNYVVIRKIIITGTEYAAQIDIPCPAGYYQDQEGMTSCNICPQDTRSVGGSASCFPCNHSSFSLPGSSECELRHSCTASDFTVEYTSCVNNTRKKYYFPLLPQICIKNTGFSIRDNGTTVSCPPCPVGFENQNGVCIACLNGNYWDSTTKKCIRIPAGSFGIPERRFFPTNTQIKYSDADLMERSLPLEFETYCSGACGTNGWRQSNDTAESGYHSSSEIDSVLVLRASIISKGSISFRYALFKEIGSTDDVLLDGLQFFIHDKLQSDVIYHPQPGVWQTASFDLELNNNEQTWFLFAWVYHQPYGSRGHDRIALSDIVITGDSYGAVSTLSKCLRGTSSKAGAAVCAPCQPGTEAPIIGASQCSPCKEGTFSDSFGSAECEPCGKGTSSSADRKGCNVERCKFEENGIEFDLSKLARRMSVVTASNRYELSLCNKLGRESMCFISGGRLLDAYICSVNLNNGTGRSMGELANVYIESTADKAPQLRLQYTKGSLCDGAQQITNINFVCNTNISGPSDGLRITDESACNVDFEWSNIAACRVCGDSDYSEQVSACVDNKQTVTWVRKAQCNGNGILNGSHVRECAPTYPVTVPIAFASVVAFIILVGVIIAIVIHNRRLHDQYELLVNEHSTQRNSGSSGGDDGTWGNRDEDKL